MIKNIYIGFDYDGTLEMPGHPVPIKLMQQFEFLKNMGVQLFLASGKNHPLLCDLATKIKLDPWMICAEAGGHIVIPSQKINEVAGAHSHLESFKEKIHTLELPPHGPEPKLSFWSKKFGQHVLDAEERIKKFISENNWNLNVYSHPDVDGGLDVMPQGIDKINLLDYIPANTTIYYMGDGNNDLSLLAHERIIPCTVSNANSAVKEVVRNKKGHTSTRAVGEGVSEIISQLFSI